MYCTECGHKNRNDRKFCENCGATLHDYTKEKTDLIYPEEIASKQKNVETQHKLRFSFNVAIYAVLAFAILFTILSFLVSNSAKLPIIIIAIVLFFVLLLIDIAKIVTLKKIDKK